MSLTFCWKHFLLLLLFIPNKKCHYYYCSIVADINASIGKRNIDGDQTSLSTAGIEKTFRCENDIDPIQDLLGLHGNPYRNINPQYNEETRPTLTKYLKLITSSYPAPNYATPSMCRENLMEQTVTVLLPSLNLNWTTTLSYLINPTKKIEIPKETWQLHPSHHWKILIPG